MGIVTICIPYELYAKICLDPMRPERVMPEAKVAEILREYYDKQKEV